MHRVILLIVGFLLFSFISVERKRITIYLVGDSTMAAKETRAFPETGWGSSFAIFFDSTVAVENHAKNGRSTRTFMEEGLWDPIKNKLAGGDYVLVQFGHNDEVPTKASYTTPQQFTANLELYIRETRSRKAIPVLITPVARRRFDSTGKLVDTHREYSALVRLVAQKQNVALIDLDKKSRDLLQELGVASSKFLFNHLQPEEHPNYPEGKTDDTHFNELGARKMAQIVLAEIRKMKLELADRIAVQNKNQ